MVLLETFLEILKYTIPGVVIYLLIRQFMNQQFQVTALEKRADLKKETLALRVQAYERMVLFCERIRLSDLVMRLTVDGGNAVTLKNSIIVTIQKEYEHNLTQQIYLSRQLWDMITLIKDNTIALVTSTYLKNEKASQDEFLTNLMAVSQELETKLGSRVKEAIRKEVELYFQ